MKFPKKVEDDFILNRGSTSVNNEISLSEFDKFYIVKKLMEKLHRGFA